MQQVLTDFEQAPLTPPLRTTLEFLRKMTLQPDALTAADARAVLNAGVTREALQEAIQVAFLFNVYDRLADTLGWHVPENASGYYDAAAKRLLSQGYA